MNGYYHLLGRSFIRGSQDCYGLVRDFYKHVFRIHLSDWPREEGWWDEVPNPIFTRARKEGFHLVDDWHRDLRPGDLPVMAVMSNTANHLGIMVEPDRMLHHWLGRLSAVESFRRPWRDATVAVLRHHRVNLHEQLEITDLLSLLPENTKEAMRRAR